MQFVIVSQSLQTGFGLEVKWTGDDKVMVNIPKSFKRNVCGLCGDFNNDKDNDWTVGPECPDHGPGTVVSNIVDLRQHRLYLLCDKRTA